MKVQRAATENKSHGYKLLSQTEAKMKREMACERLSVWGKRVEKERSSCKMEVNRHKKEGKRSSRI